MHRDTNVQLSTKQISNANTPAVPVSVAEDHKFADSKTFSTIGSNRDLRGFEIGFGFPSV